MTVLSFQNVSKVYGAGPGRTDALSDICLTIQPGETVALVGASGSGKSTALNLAAGLDRPSAGTIHLGEFPITEMSERALARMRRKQVGFVFQSLNLIPTLSAGENIGLSLELSGLPRGEQAARISSLLESAGLAGRAGAFADELSAGERQRIAALRAVAHRPGLVLMDEPTSCLDTANADRLMALLLDLNQAEGTAMILATHDLRVAERMRRTIQLHDGKIIDDRTND